jgi:hypothetical protein
VRARTHLFNQVRVRKWEDDEGENQKIVTTFTTERAHFGFEIHSESSYDDGSHLTLERSSVSDLDTLNLIAAKGEKNDRTREKNLFLL